LVGITVAGNKVFGLVDLKLMAQKVGKKNRALLFTSSTKFRTLASVKYSRMLKPSLVLRVTHPENMRTVGHA
jgi:hypothetical protein